MINHSISTSTPVREYAHYYSRREITQQSNYQVFGRWCFVCFPAPNCRWRSTTRTSVWLVFEWSKLLLFGSHSPSRSGSMLTLPKGGKPQPWEYLCAWRDY